MNAGTARIWTTDARAHLFARNEYFRAAMAWPTARCNLGHALTPGRYVGALHYVDDGEPFEEKMKRLTAVLREHQAEAAKLDAAIIANLKELGYGG